MVFTYFFIFLFSLVEPDTLTGIQDQVREQAEMYVQEIKTGNNEGLNIWALNQLATLNCESLEVVRNQVLQNSSELTDTYKQLDCGQSLDSLLELSSKKFWPESQLDLYNQIVDEEKTLSKDILDFDEYPLLHLKLLMSGDYKDYYNSEYLDQALNSWINEFEDSNQSETLGHSLILSNLIWAAYRSNKHQLIQEYYQEFLESKLIPISPYKLRIINVIDYVLFVLGNYDQSLKIQREYSLPLAKYIGSESEVNQILLRHGAYLISIGKYEESKNVFENLYQELGEDNFYVFSNLGLSYYKLGYSNRYISLQLKALEHDSQNYKNLLTVYRNLFLYYTNAKDTSSALQYIDKAKEEAIKNEDTTELALIDSYLGVFYWTQYKDHDKALKNFNKAQNILSPDDNYTKYVEILYEKGDVYTQIDSLEQARTHFEDGKKLALSKSNTIDYVDALINLTAIELKDGNIQTAGKHLEEINLYSLDNLDFPLLTKFFTVKSEFLYKTGNLREAILELAPVVEQVINRAKNNSDSQEGYWSVEDEYLEAIELLVEMLIESGDVAEALTLLDQLKTINDASLYNSPLVKATKLSEEQLAEEKRLNQRLQNLRKQYLNANADERFELNKEIDRISALREQILSEVNLDKSIPLSPIWAIQRSIADNELVLHFTEIGSSLYITHLRKNSVEIFPFNFSPEKKDRFNEIADQLASGNTNLNDLHGLYQQLEIERIPADIEHVTVIPDNFLYRLPLEVLPTHQPDSPISFGSTSYLLESFQFRYFTSLKEFEQNRRNYQNSQTIYDFSGFAISNFENFGERNLPSLPYATVETQNIQTALTSLTEKTIYTGQEATKEAFKSRVGSSRLVHVATHSEVSEQDPLFSTIYLRPQDPDDSLQSNQALYAYELFDTPLNSEFIMLNSCSSGSGNYIQGSGIMGISRALRYAGAKSLALNLWAVNDKIASEFATDFYQVLNEGESKSEAIRQAKLNQLKTGNANPHFWGAYTMIGNPAPITSRAENEHWFMGLLALGTLMFGFLAYSYKEE